MSIKSISAAVIGIAFLYGLFTVGSPFLLALVLAVLLEPVVMIAVKENRMPRALASMIVCTLVLLILIGIMYGLGERIVMQVIEFTKKMPVDWSDPNGILQDAEIQIQAAIDSLSPRLADQINNGLDSAMKSLSGLLTSVSGFFFALAKQIPDMLIYMLVFVVALYLMSMNLPGLKNSFLSLFEDGTRVKMDSVLGNLRKAITGFIVAQIILSVITFAIVMIGLLFLGMHYSLAIAFLVTVVDVLPVLGTGSVLIPWAIYAYIVGDGFLGTGLIVIFAVVTVVRRIVEPKVLGNAVGIGSLSALISLYVGFKIFGIAGLFLGPILVIIFMAMRQVGLFQFKIKLE